MRSGAVTLGVLLAGYVLQTTAFAQAFDSWARHTGWHWLGGQTIDLALLVLIYLGMHRERNSVLIWAVLVGVIANWFGLGWKGATAASFAAVALTASLLRHRVLLTGPGSLALFAGVLVLFEGFLHLFLGGLWNAFSGSVAANAGLLLSRSTLHGLAAPPVFWFLGRLDRWSGAVVERGSGSLLLDLR